MNLLVNIVAFKLGWSASVIGAANELPLIGPAVVLIAVAMHLLTANDSSSELKLIALTGIIGAAWDSIMVSAGWVSYPNGTIVAGLAPYWIIGMWLLFATTLNRVFRPLRSNLPLASLLGGIFGPASYYIGAEVGAVVINNFTVLMLALAAAWACLFPALLFMARTFDGVTNAPTIAAPAEARGVRRHV